MEKFERAQKFTWPISGLSLPFQKKICNKTISAGKRERGTLYLELVLDTNTSTGLNVEHVLASLTNSSNIS